MIFSSLSTLIVNTHFPGQIVDLPVGVEKGAVPTFVHILNGDIYGTEIEYRYFPVYLDNQNLKAFLLETEYRPAGMSFVPGTLNQKILEYDIVFIELVNIGVPIQTIQDSFNIA